MRSSLKSKNNSKTLREKKLSPRAKSQNTWKSKNKFSKNIKKWRSRKNNSKEKLISATANLKNSKTKTSNYEIQSNIKPKERSKSKLKSKISTRSSMIL